MSRDLPMPASPDRSPTWPSPVFAFVQRRSKSSSSSSRPTNLVNALPCSASKRLSTDAGRNAAQAFTGTPMPFSSCAPRSFRSKRLPSSFRVLSAITTISGWAMPGKRAAIFGVSPTTAAPEPNPSQSDHQPRPSRWQCRCGFATEHLTTACPQLRSAPVQPAPPARRRPRALADSRNRPARRRPCISPRTRQSGARSLRRTSDKPK